MTDVRGYIAELPAKAVGNHALDDELSGNNKDRLLDMLVSFDDLEPAGSMPASGAAASRSRGPLTGPI